MSKYEPVYKITPGIMNLVYKIAGEIERINIIRERVLTPGLRRENRIKTIHSSLWIEANSLSLEQVTDVINGKKVLGPLQDIAEVKNAFAAYQVLLEKNPYDLDDLLEQHKILMGGLVENAGNIRTGNVGVFAGEIPIHVAPPPDRVFGLLSDLLDWAKNSQLPQIVKSCIFHYEFEFIHPFADGNGRMGRMWQTLLLYKENPVFGWLPVETLVAEHQADYYDAIQKSTKNNDSAIFAEFMLNLIYDALRALKRKQDTPINAPINAPINDAAAEILALLNGNPYATYEEIGKNIGKDRATVRRAIAGLKDRGILKRVGSNKTGHWKIVK